MHLMQAGGAKSKVVSLSVRVPLKTADRLRELAEADERSVASEIRRLVNQRVDEADKAAA